MRAQLVSPYSLEACGRTEGGDVAVKDDGECVRYMQPVVITIAPPAVLIASGRAVTRRQRTLKRMAQEPSCNGPRVTAT